ncbi:MAG: BrnA antitoxin family protein [Nitrospirae bacterium]|nr:BrnA antitoxin family protein [Nitrospirota bacterium]
MKKKIRKFKNEDRERKFWATHDSTEYIDWSKAKRTTLPNLKPSIKTISLRLPESMLAELRLLANKRDVPYQSLLKIFLAERIEQELKCRGGPAWPFVGPHASSHDADAGAEQSRRRAEGRIKWI